MYHQREGDPFDAGSECGTDNITDCYHDGAEWSSNDRCEACPCDACNDCGTDNPDFCYPNGYPDCTLNNECEDTDCDCCGE